MYVGPAMPAAETPDKKLDQIVVYSDDKREMDRLFGDSVSYAKRQKAILAVVKRERLVEKIRRQVLGSLEGAYLVSEDTPVDVETPAIGEKGV